MRMHPEEFLLDRRGNPRRKAEHRVFEDLVGMDRRGFVRYERRVPPGEGIRWVKRFQLDEAWLAMADRQNDETYVPSRKMPDVSLALPRSSDR